MSDADLAHLASPEVLARARKIKLFLMDVDGTLTDGGVCLISSTVAGGSGEPIVSEMKAGVTEDEVAHVVLFLSSTVRCTWMGSSSSGQRVAYSLASETCRYRDVVSRSRRPSTS